MSVKKEFESGTIGWEILFIFISGAIGDIIIHWLGYISKDTKFPFAQGLLSYYKNLGNKFLIFNTNNWSLKNKSISGTVQGAIWGGIACVIALLMAKLLLFAKEEIENKR